MTPLTWLLIALFVYVVGVFTTGRAMYRRYLTHSLEAIGPVRPHERAPLEDAALENAVVPAFLWFLFWPYIGMVAAWSWRNDPTSKDPT